MKKVIIILIILVICIILGFSYAYTNYKKTIQEVQIYNAEYEQYINKTILGSDLSTIINKAINNNEINNIKKDENELYIEDNKNSVKIDVKLIDAKNAYSMEKIYSLTIEEFMKYFNLSEFKCKELQYHELSKKVKYLLFEEVKQVI